MNQNSCERQALKSRGMAEFLSPNVSWSDRLEPLHGGQSRMSRLYLIRNFLSMEETNHLRQASLRTLPRVNTSTFRKTDHDSLLDRAESVCKLIENRIAELTGIPMHEMELPLQISRKFAQTKSVHHDFNGDFSAMARVASVIIYLNTVGDGGHTVFPATSSNFNPKFLPRLPVLITRQNQVWDRNHSARKDHPIFNTTRAMCALCSQGLSDAVCVQPRQGDALFFYSRHSDGTPDQNTWHMSCSNDPYKWIATKFKAMPIAHWQRLGKTDESWARKRGLSPLTLKGAEHDKGHL